MVEDNKLSPLDADNDEISYEAFTEYLKDDIQRNKNKTAREIEELGNVFLSEIDKKKKRKKLKSDKLIPYILKHCDEKYSEEELKSYSFEDILIIYKEIKTLRKPAIIKFFHFIFNIE